MKKLTLPIIILFVFAAGFVVSRYWYSDQGFFEIIESLTTKPVEEEEEVVETVTMEVDQTSPSVLVETKEDTAEALIVAFMQKYDKSPSEVIVTVNDLTQEYASGSVSFAGEIGGGWFLAVKEDGAWKIVADGNGNILCSLVEPYEFPVDMVPECWDEDTMSLIVF